MWILREWHPRFLIKKPAWAEEDWKTVNLYKEFQHGSLFLHYEWVSLPYLGFEAAYDVILPIVLCLQKTHLSNIHQVDIRGYTCYRAIVNDGLWTHGGVAILVQNCVHSRTVRLNTQLQTVSTQIFLPSCSFAVCSIYIPPGQPVTENDLSVLVSQLPTPFISIGNFNAHNPLWGSARTCQGGELLENIISDNNHFILNTGEATDVSMATDSVSCIDLAFCSLNIAPHIEWSVLDDLYGSDHFPTVLHVHTQSRHQHWILNKVCWTAIHLSDEFFKMFNPWQIISQIWPKHQLPFPLGTFTTHQYLGGMQQKRALQSLKWHPTKENKRLRSKKRYERQ
jgi:hypothetical protein